MADPGFDRRAIMTFEKCIDAIKNCIAHAQSKPDTRQTAGLQAKWLARLISTFSLVPRRAAQPKDRRLPAHAADRSSVFADTEATWKST